MNNWKFSWHILGDIQSLIQGLTFLASPKHIYHPFLITKMDEDFQDINKKEFILNILNGKKNSDSEPLLLHYARNLAQIANRTREYPWEDWNKNYEFGIEIGKMVKDEIVLNYNKLYVPWPFIHRQGKDFRELVKQDFDPKPDLHFDSTRHLLVDPVFACLDDLVENQADEKRKKIIEDLKKANEDYEKRNQILIRFAKDLLNKELILPHTDHFKLEVHPNIPTHLTSIRSEKKTLFLDLGLILEAGRGGVMFDKWPCGAFTKNNLDCTVD